MTTVYIDSDDNNKIQEFLTMAIQKFHFKVEIAQDSANNIRKHKSVQSELDMLIRSAKPTNTAKAQKLKSAMEGLHSLLDHSKMNLSINEAKETYFNTKEN